MFHCSTTKGSFPVTKSGIHSFSKKGLSHHMFSSLLSNWLTLPLKTNGRLPNADEIKNPRLKILH